MFGELRPAGAVSALANIDFWLLLSATTTDRLLYKSKQHLNNVKDLNSLIRKSPCMMSHCQCQVRQPDVVGIDAAATIVRQTEELAYKERQE